jgi:hypothetical protein
MRTIGSVALMRVFGGSLGRMIVLVFVFSVRLPPHIFIPTGELGRYADVWIVTHGLMSRVFLMKWYHFSVEYFEDLRNVNHCEFLIMRKKEDSGKYILENNLRTWSELKRERLAAAAAKEKANPSSPMTAAQISEKDKEKEKRLLGGATESTSSTAGTISPIPVRKKWGGCPNGCDHGKHHYKKENSMHAMQLNGKPTSTSSPTDPSSTSLPFRRPAARRWQSSSDEDEDDPRGRLGPPTVDVQKSLDEVVSSPDGTPSFISVEDRLRSRLKSPKNDLLLVKSAGRDFGGSASGNTSQAGSDTEFSAEEYTRKRLAKGKAVGVGNLIGKNGIGGSLLNGKSFREQSGMGRGMLADALGDQSDVGSDAGSEAEPELAELRKEEKEDKSIKGSVY